MRIGRLPDGAAVNVEVRLTPLLDGRTTIHHERADAAVPQLRLSISGDVTRRGLYESAGQILGDVGQVDANKVWTEEDIASLIRIWSRWHLNDMQPGCAHMDASELPRDYDSRKHLVCETTGYRYGSAWLYEPLPPDVVAEVQRLQALGDAP
ncbi:MAG: hypothetical protein NVS3B1_27940 [Marmoricola sp.]